MKETVTDHFGNFLYLTAERWTHILELHSEMEGCRDRLLETLRQGTRKQDTAGVRINFRADTTPAE